MRKKEKKVFKRSIFSLWDYFMFFVLISFLLTCSFYLFFKTLDIDFDINIRRSAIFTFVNIFFLSLLFAIIDGIRQKFMVERPVKRILEATRQLTKGDFTVRIKPINRTDRMNEFDAIIEDFNKMAEELGGMETLRADFVANVSHEIKTPLAIIQNYAAALQKTDISPEQRDEYTGTIITASEKLSTLITNILKLSKLENQKIVPKPEEYDLCAQLAECALSFEEMWEKKSIAFKAEMDDKAVIFADKDMLDMVWNNLLSNAFKFCEPGDTVTLSQASDGDTVSVSVSDTGCGISEIALPRVFDKFYQGDTSHSQEGNGLGLALVHRVVELLGGHISAHSIPGEGSVFTVCLNIRQ
ncbi:MAG: HAMP domain-containing histidine kinase [Oscillospiraceae bacterium]|nr:HAMP domain-containing histidine kinase [Oscillospiraceae bacterium]